MSKPKFDNNNSSLKHKTGSLMASNPLIDSLTSHISLYHSAISNGSSSLNRNPNPRLSILKWFSSLTVHQRQASLTIVDHGFVQILLQMLGKMRTQGHGFFIVLPDLPSRDSAGMPSLCFRKSNGLLARASEVNDGERFVYEAVLMFESNEGEEVTECECSSKRLDTVTVSEEFVANVDRFVGVMDGVSNGEFLRGEENVMGSSDWIELGWLKDKGYYNVEAFVANRIEVALRLAWLNSNRNKKKGVKLKEKVDAAGVAANVYWRKKGCVDWWGNLDATLKIKVLTGVLGKAAKPLVDEILNGASKGTKGEMCIFNTEVEKPLRYNYSKVCRKTTVVSFDAAFDSLICPATVSTNHTPFAKCLNRLFVLLDICTLVLSCHHHEYDNDTLFYSTLGSVNTISDCILRKLRGLLMVVSLDCIKRELLEEGNQGSTPIKCNEKIGVGNRKKKSKTRNTKRLNPALESSGIDEPLKSTLQSQRCEQFHKQNGKAVESENVAVIHLEKNKDILSSEHPRNLGAKGNNATRKCRRERRKTKKALPNSISINIVASSNANSKIQGNTLEPDGSSDELSVQNGVKDTSLPAHCILNSSLNDSVNRSLKEEIVPVSISNVVTGCTSGGCQNDVISHQNLKSSIATSVVISNEVDKLSNSVDCNITTTAKPSPNELGSGFSSKSCNFWNTGHSSGNRSKSVSKATDREQECEISFNTERTSSMDCISYEWPNVAPIHSSMAKSPIPAATDRLHLDAGRNWHNHFHRSFVPAMHQTRNPSIEGGGSRMGSRPLPVSLDWPPMVRAGALAPSVACNYDYKFISRRQSSFQQAFTAQNVRIKATTIDDERKIFGDSIEVPDPTNMLDFSDDGDSHWISEEEYEMHAMDCNQYFGGGVMYWDPSDIPRTSFSRPPSLSSDDSSWAWHEVEMKRAVDDMVAFSSSYSTNGLTSPTAASYCSAFDPLGTAHQALGYVMPPGNEGTGMVMHPASAVVDSSLDEKISGSMSTFPSDVEGLSGDSLPYPILPPIIIPNLSRERSRSEFQRSHEHRSPCVPPFRRDHPRIKRPPSPVVLCVPQAPSGPPPPSSVSNSRKHRGFPTVRSGSSSPRNWGVKGWYNDGANFDESCICMDGTEVILPSWRSNNLSARPMVQALPGALFSDHVIAISHMALDKEHPDVTFPIEPPDSLTCLTWKTSRPLMQNFLHDEINSFCKQVAAENVSRKPYINWAVNRVTRALQVLWPRSRTNIFGSIATGLSLPSSDVDLVVGLPPVRNLEPIKEAGILEGRNGIKETCLQHAARYLSNQEWVKSDSLKTVENTAIPIIMLVVEVPYTLITNVTSHLAPKGEATCITSEGIKQVHLDNDGLQNSGSPTISNPQDECGKDPKLVRIDISFKSPSHTGVQTTKLVKELTELFPAATPLALVLKQFLSDRSLDQSYCGGLSSYCLMLLITRFLQHEHHLGRSINQNFGSLLMDFLYFFGNVYDPRQIRISVQGSGVYIKRERGYSIDPIHIDDPLFPTNNVGRNCFRIHQCIKAFSDAYSLLESELPGIPTDGGLNTVPPCRLLPKIIPSIDLYRKSKD